MVKVLIIDKEDEYNIYLTNFRKKINRKYLTKNKNNDNQSKILRKFMNIEL